MADSDDSRSVLTIGSLNARLKSNKEEGSRSFENWLEPSGTCTGQIPKRRLSVTGE